MFIDDSIINLPQMAQANVPTPAAGRFVLYFDSSNGHLCQMDSSRAVIDLTADTVSLFEPNSVMLFLPANAAIGTGTGYGTTWNTSGTVSHVTPTFASRQLSLYKTRWANVATTANQTLGVYSSGLRYARTSLAGVGGFYFKARFSIDLIPAPTIRLFVGMGSSVTQIVSDSFAGDFIGLFHDTTDSNTTLNWLSVANSVATKTAITVPALAANNTYEVEILCQPAATSISCILRDFNNNNNVLSSQSITATLPTVNSIMVPIAHMSNGTANTTANSVALGLSSMMVRTIN